MRIIFYSQTGTGEDFSKRLMEEAETYGFAPEVTDAEEYAGMTVRFIPIRLLFKCASDSCSGAGQLR